MSEAIKTKKSFGTVKVSHFSPARGEGWPKAINVALNFEEALKLYFGLGQILGKLNSYDRSTKRGRDAAVNLCIYSDGGQVMITESQLRKSSG